MSRPLFCASGIPCWSAGSGRGDRDGPLCIDGGQVRSVLGRRMYVLAEVDPRASLSGRGLDRGIVQRLPFQGGFGARGTDGFGSGSRDTNPRVLADAAAHGYAGRDADHGVVGGRLVGEFRVSGTVPAAAAGMMISVSTSACPSAVVSRSTKKSSAAIVRWDELDWTDRSAPRASATAGKSLPGSAWLRLPPRVPLLRTSGSAT